MSWNTGDGNERFSPRNLSPAFRRTGSANVGDAGRLAPVTTRLRKLEAQNLRLPSRDRVRLAERILRTLDRDSDAECERLWLEEVERRLDEVESGTARTMAAHVVMREVRSKLR
jgi:hypothetical protein